MKTFLFFLCLTLLTLSCKNPSPSPVLTTIKSENSTYDTAPQNTMETPDPPTSLINPTGKTIATRFLLPTDYQRVTPSENSFARYLQKLPLKDHGATVHYHNGGIKPNNDVYEAVVDLPIGKKDLHQCADAIMRLKAEYHWQQKQYDQIHFNFTNGFRVDYSEWRAGRKMIVEGNKTYWNNDSTPRESYDDFWKYLELIFTYAGTASLSKELKSIPLADMEIGDVFIQGGHPGHAVIVLDMAKHPTTGEQLFLLGQSYMPAQELQVLTNRNEANISPWYRLVPGTDLSTPEWEFTSRDLKRF